MIYIRNINEFATAREINVISKKFNFQILAGEVGLWAFAEDRQRTIRVLCRNCRVPQVTRRLVRFVGMFGLFHFWFEYRQF